MALHRIWAVCLRHFYLFRHSLDKKIEAFYWPIVQLVLWSFTGRYFETRNGADARQPLIVITSGVVLWLLIWRGQCEITANLLEDMWNRNIPNMFGSPLRLREWLAGILIVGLLKGALTCIFAGCVAWIFYGVNLYTHGLMLLPFLGLMITTSGWMGLLVGAVIIRFGSKVQQLAAGLVFILTPFSAIYYPVDALPTWARAVARVVPTSYLFEGARKVVLKGILDWNDVLKAFALTVIYCCLACCSINYSFRHMLQKGLTKLY